MNTPLKPTPVELVQLRADVRKLVDRMDFVEKIVLEIQDRRIAEGEVIEHPVRLEVVK